MKMLIDETTFISMMESSNSGLSYEALSNLFNYLEDIDDDYTLDTIALRCEFSEYDIDKLIDMYNLEDEIDGIKDMDDYDKYDAVLDWLRNRTTAIKGKEDTIVIADF